MSIYPKPDPDRTNDSRPRSQGVKKSMVALAVVVLGIGIAAQIFLGEEIGAIGDYLAGDKNPTLEDSSR